MLESYSQHFDPGSPGSASFDDETSVEQESETICKQTTPVIQGELFNNALSSLIQTVVQNEGTHIVLHVCND